MFDHVGFGVTDYASSKAFFLKALHPLGRSALEAGGRDNGAPGPRPHYHASYYGAFIIGPDGHNVEAVCHKPEAQFSAQPSMSKAAHVPPQQVGVALRIPTVETDRLLLLPPSAEAEELYRTFYTDERASHAYGGPLSGRKEGDLVGACGFWQGKAGLASSHGSPNPT